MERVLIFLVLSPLNRPNSKREREKEGKTRIQVYSQQRARVQVTRVHVSQHALEKGVLEGGFCIPAAASPPASIHMHIPCLSRALEGPCPSSVRQHNRLTLRSSGNSIVALALLSYRHIVTAEELFLHGPHLPGQRHARALTLCVTPHFEVVADSDRESQSSQARAGEHQLADSSTATTQHQGAGRRIFCSASAVRALW